MEENRIHLLHNLKQNECDIFVEYFTPCFRLPICLWLKEMFFIKVT